MEYMTTKEIARYLHLNEKKVYAMVADGQLPASRISGKWLFPRELVDRWIEQNTIYPGSGVIDSILEDMVIMQGSDDWLLSRVTQDFTRKNNIPVVTATVGSMAGLKAVSGGKAHLAGCHIARDQARELSAGSGKGCYMMDLFSRRQGLIFDRERHPGITGLQSVEDLGLCFAERQQLSGTFQLVRRLFEDLGVPDPSRETAGESRTMGPCSSHMEVALAVRTGKADAGVGIQVAADLCGLDFIPLHTEPYRIAIPTQFFSRPHMVGFLDFILSELKSVSSSGVSGYEFDDLGRLDVPKTIEKEGISNA